MIVSVSEEAELELTDAARYYAQQGGSDLGMELIAEFERSLNLLADQPQLGALWRNRRRLPMRRFPFSIIYYVSGDSLRVIAWRIIDALRNIGRAVDSPSLFLIHPHPRRFDHLSPLRELGADERLQLFGCAVANLGANVRVALCRLR